MRTIDEEEFEQLKSRFENVYFEEPSADKDLRVQHILGLDLADLDDLEMAAKYEPNFLGIHGKEYCFRSNHALRMFVEGVKI